MQVRKLDESIELIQVKPDTELDTKNEGKSFYVEGELRIEGSPADPEFNFIAEGYIDLYRKVEVLMWEEKITYDS